MTQSTEKEKLGAMGKGIQLVGTFNKLPQELCSLLHTIEYPVVDGLSLAYGMLGGTLLGSKCVYLKQKVVLKLHSGPVFNNGCCQMLDHFGYQVLNGGGDCSSIL